MRKLKTYNTLIGILIIVLLGYVIFLMTRDRAELFNRYEGVDVVMDYKVLYEQHIPLALQDAFLSERQEIPLNIMSDLGLDTEERLALHETTHAREILDLGDNLYGLVYETTCTAGGECSYAHIALVRNGDITDVILVEELLIIGNETVEQVYTQENNTIIITRTEISGSDEFNEEGFTDSFQESFLIDVEDGVFVRNAW